jgi:hypothetical protein
MAMSINSAEWETLLAARNELQRSAQGSKGEICARYASLLRCSVQTLYRKLAEAGLETGRKRRADAGRTGMTEAELRLVAGMLYHSRRDNDKQLLTTEDALDMLHASGQLKVRLSAGRVQTLLREHGLHPDQLAQPTPAVELRSLHPNHVWQVDASVCVLYYLRSGHLAAMDADEFYRNKPGNFAKVLHELCTRYAVTDHTSSAFKARYYLGGESAQNLVDFFLYAVTKQDASPMHGVPFMLMMDPGSAAKGHLMANLAKRVECKLIINEAGNPRAKGSVERTHDLIERHYEGTFRFMDAADLTLDGINARCETWAAAYCSQRRHTRHGQPRYSVWMGITAEQLRVPASLEVLRELVHSQPETRRVSNTKTITFAALGGKAHTYDVSTVPGVAVGGKVTAVLNAYRAPAIDVRVVDEDTGEEHWQMVSPVERDQYGFSEHAVTIGEQHRTAAFTEQDHNRNRITQEAYRKPGEGLPTLEEAAKARKRHEQAYAGIVDAQAHVRAVEVPAYLPRRGTALDVGPLRKVVAQQLAHVEAAVRLRAMLGEAYSPQVYQHLVAQFPDAVPEDRLEEVAAAFAPPATQQGSGVVPLRAAGGDQ